MMAARVHKSAVALKPANPTLLVTGDGASLLRDLEQIAVFDIAYDVAAIGRSVKLFDSPEHWFNADGETAMAWAKQVKDQKGAITHTLGEVEGFDVDWDLHQPDYQYEKITGERGRAHGSSALFAALAGLEMGYARVILAGCPLDTGGHWYFAPEGPETMGPLWMGLDFAAWLDFAAQGNAYRVRSMSGYTARIMGKVDHRWLNNGSRAIK